jgi:hypothetical protein
VSDLKAGGVALDISSPLLVIMIGRPGFLFLPFSYLRWHISPPRVFYVLEVMLLTIRLRRKEFAKSTMYYTFLNICTY